MNNSKKKILVIDDDKGILEVIRIILEDNGFEVISKDESNGAMDLIEQEKPDLILIDIWMSGEGGEEITKKTKQNKSTQHIPIIMVSANQNTDKIAKNSGADSFITKPFDIDGLVRVIQQFCFSFVFLAHGFSAFIE